MDLFPFKLYNKITAFLCISIFHCLQDHSKEGGVHAQFLLFDDQKIRPLGTWEDVKKECLKSLYQPVLLLYELQDSKNQNLNSAVDKHDEKEKENENEKEKEREKEKDDSRSLILRDPSLDKSDKFHITSIFTSSSPRKKDMLLGNKSALRQMLEDADSASVIAKQRSDSSPPLPSTSLSSPTVSAVTSFTSLASFGGKKYSADNFNFILSPAVSKDVLFDFQRKESQDEREQKFEFEQNIAIDILPIRVYENRPLLSYVTLVYEIYNGKKLLGFEHGMDELGRVIFVNFPKHPGTGKYSTCIQ